MKLAGAFATLALLLVAAAPVAARTRIVTPNGAAAEPYQFWIDHAKIPTPAATMVLHRGRCLDNPDDDAGGCVVPYGPDQAGPFHVWLWDTPDAQPPASRGQLYHEIGHVFQYSLPGAVRERLVWKVEAYLRVNVPEHDGEELVAEAFKFCAKNPTAEPLDWFQDYDYDPGVWQHRKICRAIAGAATAAGVR